MRMFQFWSLYGSSISCKSEMEWIKDIFNALGTWPHGTAACNQMIIFITKTRWNMYRLNTYMFSLLFYLFCFFKVIFFIHLFINSRGVGLQRRLPSTDEEKLKENFVKTLLRVDYTALSKHGTTHQCANFMGYIVLRKSVCMTTASLKVKAHV